MTEEEMRFQVAVSCIQGIIEAKHGIIAEVLPDIAVQESLRIADKFVKEWFKDEPQQQEHNNYMQGWNDRDANILQHSIEGRVLKAGKISIVKEKNVDELRELLTGFNDQEDVYIAIFKKS